MRGGAAWLLNLIINLFKNRIKREIENAREKLNAELMRIPYTVNLPLGIGLDYSLHRRPVYGQGFISIPSKGEFYNAHHREPSGFMPRTSPDSFPGGKMIYILIDNFVPMTGGATLHKKGLLKLEILDSMVPPESPVRLTSNGLMRISFIYFVLTFFLLKFSFLLFILNSQIINYKLTYFQLIIQELSLEMFEIFLVLNFFKE